jgi:LAS superfamily LD-carboxypeptidase LdcB
MTCNQPARAAARHVPATIFTAAVVLNAALIGVLVHQSLASPSSSAAPATEVNHGGQDSAPAAAPALPPEVTIADGAVPDGVTVFDEELPAVGNLDADLLAALRHAATDAADDGVEFVVNSGWRSPEFQQELLREAVSKYGSEEEAARWVATPDTSAHVSGDAVDIGPSDATAWLSMHGAAYGLCQIYDNEPWHYELRYEAIDYGCPASYADPTRDPRMQQ